MMQEVCEGDRYEAKTIQLPFARAASCIVLKTAHLLFHS